MTDGVATLRQLYAGAARSSRRCLVAALVCGALVIVYAVLVPIYSTAANTTVVPLFMGLGARVLVVAGLPLVITLIVGWLLELDRQGSRPWARTLAWALSLLVLLTGIVGFVTFFIGLLVVPTGAFLVAACWNARRARQLSRDALRATGHPSNGQHEG